MPRRRREHILLLWLQICRPAFLGGPISKHNGEDTRMCERRLFASCARRACVPRLCPHVAQRAVAAACVACPRPLRCWFLERVHVDPLPQRMARLLVGTRGGVDRRMDGWAEDGTGVSARAAMRTGEDAEAWQLRCSSAGHRSLWPRCSSLVPRSEAAGGMRCGVALGVLGGR